MIDWSLLAMCTFVGVMLQYGALPTNYPDPDPDALLSFHQGCPSNSSMKVGHSLPGQKPPPGTLPAEQTRPRTKTPHFGDNPGP